MKSADLPDQSHFAASTPRINISAAAAKWIRPKEYAVSFHAREDSELRVFLPVGRVDVFDNGRIFVFDSVFPALTFPIRLTSYDIVAYQQLST